MQTHDSAVQASWKRAMNSVIEGLSKDQILNEAVDQDDESSVA